MAKKLFGRCLSKKGAKKLERTGILDAEKSLVPVFDATHVHSKLVRKTKDQIKGLFKQIGVRSAQVIEYFTIPENINLIGPIPQSNGLVEYKIPSGTPVEVMYKTRL
jgi:hypothetical protein